MSNPVKEFERALRNASRTASGLLRFDHRASVLQEDTADLLGAAVGMQAELGSNNHWGGEHQAEMEEHVRKFVKALMNARGAVHDLNLLMDRVKRETKR
jgi:hypothetical protein